MLNIKIKKINLVVFLFLVSFLIVSSVRAEEKQGPCHDDVEKLCKDVERGQGRIMKCLVDHNSEVASACSTHLENVKKKREEMKKNCAADVEKFCKTEKESHKGVGACLEQHKSELAGACAAGLDKAKNKASGK